MNSAKASGFSEVPILTARQAVEYAEASSGRPCVMDVGGLKRDIAKAFEAHGWSERAAEDAARDCVRAVLVGR
ncbi:hypothetical protein DMP07_04540 [Slackia faecicanis]|uniref:Uncharacterized protein n=1 Tax=Slackia faecicanis TaxID=255723 RepID=A0A3N0AGA6_9ACTN|nr:hypothetical protein [Slackia faecicanis]RNL20852.1 hypothetical protein DMP07_04540 [Slackia faecicanis]